MKKWFYLLIVIYLLISGGSAYSAVTALRSYTNPAGVTFTVGNTTRWYAEDALEIKSGIQDGTKGIFTEWLRLSLATADTLISGTEGSCIYRDDLNVVRCNLG